MEDAERGRIRMTLLRPIAWLMLLGAEVGAAVPVQLPELGLVGPACVTAIAPCPAIEPGPPGTAIVTGTFVTERAPLIELYIDGLDRPIGVTPSHPFWSVSRLSWVPAASLRGDEFLPGQRGPMAVANVDWRDSLGRAYNIEVHRCHTYHVSVAGLLVHNECRTYKSIKDWEGYNPRFRVRTQKAVRINNREFLQELRKVRPGDWRKIYQYGFDGRELHFFRHPSGLIVNPKWK
ncbi:MAG: polymorphic toxin-type HINT domain-containing protein [Planctomycetota bacterium]